MGNIPKSCLRSLKKHGVKPMWGIWVRTNLWKGKDKTRLSQRIVSLFIFMWRNEMLKKCLFLRKHFMQGKKGWPRLAFLFAEHQLKWTSHQPLAAVCVVPCLPGQGWVGFCRTSCDGQVATHGTSCSLHQGSGSAQHPITDRHLTYRLLMAEA